MGGLGGNNPFVSFDPPPAPVPAPVPRPAPAPPPPAPPPPAARIAAPLPAPVPAEGAAFDDNPFAAFDPSASLPPPEPAQAMPSGIPDWGAPQQAQQAMPSGIPDWGTPQQAQQAMPSGIPDWAVPASPAPGCGAPAPLPDRPSMVPAPPAAPPPVDVAPVVKKDSGDRKGPRLVQRLATAAVQLVVVAILVVSLIAVGLASMNEGRVELSDLTPERLREEGSPTQPLVAKEVSNGLYETQGAQPLFFVRGEVENRGTSPTRVTVGVSLYDGTQRVKSAEGLAGAVPSPEEFNAVRSAEDAQALRSRLDASSLEVAQGARVPFIVFFHEFPAELANFRLEVTLTPRDGATPAGGLQEGSAGDAQP